LKNNNEIVFPEKGASEEQVLKDLTSLKNDDVNWASGKSFGYVYYPGEKYAKIIKKAYDLFFHDNALNPQLFPSLRKLEAEVVAMVNHLFNAPSNASGCMTSGGTESILLSLKTARDYSKSLRPFMEVPEVIIPSSAHPAFLKGVNYFGLKAVVVPTNNLIADVSLMAEKINNNTVMLVGSAPSFPHGLIDPIEELSNLALEHNLLLHVDCCIGGFMLPFMNKLGWDLPDFDFKLKGVTSISVDIHKYGYAAKGASVILYRNRSLRKFQFSIFTKWSGGVYGSTTMLGTKPGGSIAAAWAAINAIGMNGYLKLAKQTMESTNLLLKKLNDIPELSTIGEPVMSLVAIQSKTIDIHELADEMHIKGWSFDRLQYPSGIHLTISQVHTAEIIEEFISDLKLSINKVKYFSLSKKLHRFQVSTLKLVSKLLPHGSIAKIQKRFSSIDPTPKRAAAMYGMLGVLPDKDLDKIVQNLLDKLNSLDQ
jgi:glutamate/tyrosine decarboxylase-like PLP-dependent enzyme